MVLFCVILLLLHQGYTLIPVTTVQLGEPATITCVLPYDELGLEKLYWFKQSVGDNLKIIVTMWKSAQPVYGPELSGSRLVVNNHKEFSNLTILRTRQEDEGIYHCASIEWIDIKWSGTYLLVKGNTERTSNYTVVQQPTVSDPVRPGDSMTLQCSVLSDSENKTCPRDYSVFWFRVTASKSHPNIIYTDGNRHDDCEKRSDTQKSCIYHFSKNVSSSDAGTYYCAVATCGEILFGDGAKVEIVETTHTVFIAMAILILCLVISAVVNVVLICNRNVREQYDGMERTTSEARHDNLFQPAHDNAEANNQLNYAALSLSKRGRQTREFAEDSVYSQVTD